MEPPGPPMEPHGLKSVTTNKQGCRNGFSKVAPQEGLHGGSMGGPLGFTIFYHNQKHYWHLLKSVTINEQGRRNGFSKGSPLVWGPGAPWGGPWGSQIFTKTQKCLGETLETVGSHFHKSYVTNNASTTSSVNLRTKAP